MALRRGNLNFLEPKKTKIEPVSIFEICSSALPRIDIVFSETYNEYSF